MEDHNELPPPRSADTPVPDEGGRETQHAGMPSRRQPPPWPIGHRLGDFELEVLLGQGSSGYVFRALDLVTKRRCALKILTPESPQDLRRNRIGFRRMQAIEHPGLMRVDLIHILDGHVALSMEEIEGDTLARALRRYKTLQPHQAYKRLLALTRHYAAALAEMHSHGLVHRDIKPQNLMVDSRECGRVIDYGLVGTFDPETDVNGFRHYLAGTPRYWSPEALRNQFYTPSGDVFSLGLVMLEALYAITGRREWERAKHDRDKDAQLISEAVDDLSESIPNVLRNACLEMLQIKPADRPSAHEISRLGLPTAKNFVWYTGQRLYGRESELEQICDWLRTVYEGKSGRLHIHGLSGIGKTRLIDEVERHLRSLRWGQVFRATCRARKDQTLQAFDQFADQIANRYACNDREPLEVDVVSAAILRQTFPVLADVVTARMQLPPISSTNQRLVALEAAIKLSFELRKVGPLILIIDNIQWADQDSSELLDRLQTDCGEMLGIITVGRESATSQQKSPSRVMEITPIDAEASCRLLADAAKRWSVNINRAAIRELADSAAGNPFRLGELCEEFRPGGALCSLQPTGDSAASNIGSISSLWKRRAKGLSEQARTILPLVATAGRPVSTQQLDELTGLGDQVDVAVSELAQQRLISDEASGGECIYVAHDRVANGVISGLSDDEHRQAHLAWAQLLLRAENQEQLAARIAGHLFDAGQPSRALSYAILAAEHAERRYAKTEAAKWYVRVAKLVRGEERLQHLRDAARCYDEADQPVEAAEYYQQLAAAVDDADERIAYQIIAIQLLIRSGHMDAAGSDLQTLLAGLRLPLPRSTPQTVLSFAADRLPLARLRAFRLTASEQPTVKPPSDHHQQRLDMCFSLARPLCFFDAMLAARLVLIGSKLAAQYGTRAQQLHFALGAAVYACSDCGTGRIKGESLLKELRPQVMDQHDPQTRGDYWAAIATANALSMRWLDVADASRISVNEYEAVEKPHRFEISQTRWLELWAAWHLGDWQTMRVVGREMLENSQRHNDLYGQFVSSSGFAAAVLLADDRLAELKSLQHQNSSLLPSAVSTQLVDLFRWISHTQRDLYNGDLLSAWQCLRAFQRKLKYSPLARGQLVRMLTHWFRALIALHLAQANRSLPTPAAGRFTSWLRVSRRSCQRLREHQNQYAGVLADQLEGIGLVMQHRTEEARDCLLAAQRSAASLQLLPFQLAAEDALEFLETGEWLGLLRHRMRNRSIKCAEAFERLYTVVPCGK
jgi:tRNA A-37 threonylcarbamoyl transferase component Bud32